VSVVPRPFSGSLDGREEMVFWTSVGVGMVGRVDKV